MAKFEVYKDVAGQWRFRLRAANGEPLLASEGYESKSGAMNGIEAIRRVAENAPVVFHDEEDVAQADES